MCRHCHNLTYRKAKEHNKRFEHLIENPELLAGVRGTEAILLALRAYGRV